MNEKYDLSSIGARPSKSYDLSSLGAKPYTKNESSNEEDVNNQLSSEHPFLYKIAEMLSKHPGLQKGLENTNKYFTDPLIGGVNQLGLPIAAEHALTLPRLPAEMITGKEFHADTQNTNPNVAQAAKRIGQVLGAGAMKPVIGQMVNALPQSRNKMLQDLMREHAENESTLNKQKAQSSHDFGTNNPDRLDLMSQDKISELQNAMKRYEELSQGKQLPPEPSELIEHNAQQSVTNAKKNISEFGGEGQNFPKRISDEFMSFLRGEKNPETGIRERGYTQMVGRRYQSLSEKLNNENITFRETPDLVKLANQTKKQFPELSDDYQKQITEKWANDLSSEKKINASEFLESYRGFKQELRNITQKYFEPGISIKDQRMIKPEINQLKNQIQEMKKIMDNQLGKRYVDRLKSIDKQYATEIAPLARNQTYQALKKGNIPANPLQTISLDTPGNNTLRMAVNNSKELQRLLFGERFASKPENLLKPNEVVSELAKENPKINELIQDLMKSTKELEPRMEFAKQQKEFEQLSQDIPKLKKEIDTANEYSENIREAMKAKGLSKDQIKKLEIKLAKSQKRRDSLSNLFKLHTYLKYMRPF